MIEPFPQLFRRCLAAAEIDQKAFARACGMSYSYINKVANGHRGPPDGIEQWADLLGLQGAQRQAFLDSAAVALAPPRMRELLEMAAAAQAEIPDIPPLRDAALKPPADKDIRAPRYKA